MDPSLLGDLLDLLCEDAPSSDGSFMNLGIGEDAGRNGLREGRGRDGDEEFVLSDGVLQCAAAADNVPLCASLVEDLRVDVNFRNHRGETALLAAAIRGSLNAAKYLLERGADPAAPNCRGRAPLHIAAMHGHCEIIKLLLAKGAPVDAASSRATPLHFAVCHDREQAMEILLEHHADVNRIGFFFFTPLLISVFRCSLKCMELLIKAGADVNYHRSSGYTPLSVAIEVASPEHVKLLLDSGADPDFRDRLGQLPIEEAAILLKWETVELLFPRSSPLPSFAEWSVDGIMRHVNSEQQIREAQIRMKNKRDELKVEAGDAFQQKDFTAAAMLYRLAMEALYRYGLDRDATLYANRSVCWLKLGEGGMALLDANVSIKWRPSWPKAHYRRGAALSYLKDYERACAAFLAGLKLDPENDEIKKALWEAVESMKKAHRAKKR